MALLDHLQDFWSAGGHFLHPVAKACFQKWAAELSWLHCSDLTSTAVLTKLANDQSLLQMVWGPHVAHTPRRVYVLSAFLLIAAVQHCWESNAEESSPTCLGRNTFFKQNIAAWNPSLWRVNLSLWRIFCLLLHMRNVSCQYFGFKASF